MDIISHAYYFGPTLKTQQESLGFLLADASRMMRRTLQQELEGSSLTLAEARALVYVSRNEGVRQVELADLLEVQPITLARLIDTLEQGGLVERRADPADRRAYLIFLTPAAAPRLAAIETAAARVRAVALRGLGRQQAADLMAALRKMRENLAAAD
jgi:DNA-binding MarR family transcriptional regulator